MQSNKAGGDSRLAGQGHVWLRLTVRARDWVTFDEQSFGRAYEPPSAQEPATSPLRNKRMLAMIVGINAACRRASLLGRGCDLYL